MKQRSFVSRIQIFRINFNENEIAECLQMDANMFHQTSHINNVHCPRQAMKTFFINNSSSNTYDSELGHSA